MLFIKIYLAFSGLSDFHSVVFCCKRGWKVILTNWFCSKTLFKFYQDRLMLQLKIYYLDNKLLSILSYLKENFVPQIILYYSERFLHLAKNILFWQKTLKNLHHTIKLLGLYFAKFYLSNVLPMYWDVSLWNKPCRVWLCFNQFSTEVEQKYIYNGMSTGK